MSKFTFILTQDCWRWRLMNGDEEILRSEDTWEDRDSAVTDLMKKQQSEPEYLDVDLAEERMIVERTQVRLTKTEGVESLKSAYQRGYDEAKREFLEKLK